ncbi:MAG: hypothetical protein A3G93_13880 [Nitrospinae bacterium RIFCSPLOWO2_12_FULL_45_22]|nr:MAG: hypothetical protein A3G93_13880 [Nitrospinae bacterium RIFCSPLOWO2_12_FULL_45_22]
MPIDQENIDRENNERALSRLIELLKTGRALAFVGSGSSKRVGYPDWDELLSLMEGEIRTKDPTFNGSFHREAGDTLWHAYKLKERLGENFYPFIKKTFEPKNNRHNAFHINLMSLSFQHIITSNYDSVLEDAFSGLRKSKPVERFCWNEKEKLCDFIRRMNDPLYKDTIQIFYVHGRYDSQDSIVLTERDYTNRYHEGNLAIKCLWLIAATRQVVFVGFSFQDFDLLSAFRQVRGDFGGGDSRHFALVGIEPNKDRIIRRNYLNDKFGVEPIFYDIIEGKHDELDKLVIKILGEFGLKTSLMDVIEPKHDSIDEDVRRLQEYTTKAYDQIKSGKSK